MFQKFSTLSLFRRTLLLVLVFAFSLTGPFCSAQGPTLSGEITDPSGAALAKVQITFTNTQTHVAHHAFTNVSGQYLLPSLPSGEYTLTVEAVGFANYRQTITLTATQNPALNIKLSLETASMSVDVRADAVSLQQIPTLGKTGTMIEDIPQSVQVIGRELVDAQGGTELKDTLRNSSGVLQGGSDSFGFGDRFLIRGLEARIYNDGFSDGDGRNGIPHSLNGVERVEILEGPGSSLFGSGPPGGTINVVHYSPSDKPAYGIGFQAGSFNLFGGTGFATGSTAISGLDYRVDGLAQHEDGFRALPGADYELRPALSLSAGHHYLLFSVDARDLQATPDPAGLIYVNGAPITGVSREAKYSTPFSIGDQSMVRTTFSDLWPATSHLTLSTRFSYMYRNLSILRNGDGGTVTGIVFSGRQLRKQHDTLNDFDFMSEPVWSFKTGKIRHTLLAGVEAQHQGVVSNRSTADLQNIVNIFAPVVPETSTAGLVFLQDAKHSGFLDDLSATYLGFYATDQIDLTGKLKVRIGARQDLWNTQLAPQVFVPGRILVGNQLIEPPNLYTREDHPISWSAGAVYRLLPGVSPFFGAARSNLVNFSSESTQNGVQAPESGLQYEAGVKAAAFNNRMMLTVAGFDVMRNNVFTLVGDVPVFNDQKTQGGEADLQLFLGHGWRVLTNGTGQHAWLTDNPSNPAATGKRPVGVPSYIFNFWTEYDFKLAGAKGFRVGGGLTSRDRMFGDVLNTKSIPAYTTLDAIVGYTGYKWTASLDLRNLTDRLWFVAANGGGGFVGVPRSFSIQIKRNFGSTSQ